MLKYAWLKTSKDIVVGNYQRGDAFWKRIAVYFASSPNVFSQMKRASSQCRQRWGKFNKSVCMFVGCHTAVWNE